MEELDGILAAVRANWGVVDDASQMPAQVLAYIGDAFYNLYVRLRVISLGPSSAVEIHRRAVSRVSAPAQADLLDSLAPGLDGDEALVVRRGRNVRSSRQGKAPGASYTASTAFEALLGYLLVSGQHERLYEVLDTEWGKQGGS